jgi:four helix bundle protein
MSVAKSFRDLTVWQKAHSFVLSVYHATKEFPKHELYGLTSQLRRAAVSVPGNIAEGFHRKTKADKMRFLNIAQSSLEEARYYLILSEDLQYGKHGEIWDQSDEVGRLLSAYYKAIQTSMTNP